MSVKQTLEALEQQCRDMGVRLMYDDLRSEGGLCRLRDRFYVVVNRRAAPETRIRIIREALAKLPTMSLPLPPVSAVERAAEAAPPAAEPEATPEAAPAPHFAGTGVKGR